MESDGEDPGKLSRSAGLYLGLAHVKDAFHRVKISKLYSSFFAPCIGRVCLCFSSLPMGHTWSLFFCQKNNRRGSVGQGLGLGKLRSSRTPGAATSHGPLVRALTQSLRTVPQKDSSSCFDENELGCDVQGDGSLMARLVVQSFTDQRLGNISTSSPAASRRSRQIFLTLAASLRFQTHKGDVKCAFFQGDLDEQHADEDDDDTCVIGVCVWFMSMTSCWRAVTLHLRLLMASTIWMGNLGVTSVHTVRRTNHISLPQIPQNTRKKFRSSTSGVFVTVDGTTTVSHSGHDLRFMR